MVITLQLLGMHIICMPSGSLASRRNTRGITEFSAYSETSQAVDNMQAKRLQCDNHPNA